MHTVGGKPVWSDAVVESAVTSLYVSPNAHRTAQNVVSGCARNDERTSKDATKESLEPEPIESEEDEDDLRRECMHDIKHELKSVHTASCLRKDGRAIPQFALYIMESICDKSWGKPSQAINHVFNALGTFITDSRNGADIRQIIFFTFNEMCCLFQKHMFEAIGSDFLRQGLDFLDDVAVSKLTVEECKRYSSFLRDRSSAISLAAQPTSEQWQRTWLKRISELAERMLQPPSPKNHLLQSSSSKAHMQVHPPEPHIDKASTADAGLSPQRLRHPRPQQKDVIDLTNRLELPKPKAKRLKPTSPDSHGSMPLP